MPSSLLVVGIGIEVQAFIQRAQVEFMETRAAMRQLAPLVAKAKGLLEGRDYTDAVRALKGHKIVEDNSSNLSTAAGSTQIDLIISRAGDQRCAAAADADAPWLAGGKRRAARTVFPSRRRWSALPASRASSCRYWATRLLAVQRSSTTTSTSVRRPGP